MKNIYNNRIQNTTIQNTKSKRKQARVSEDVHQIIKVMAKKSNKTYTQGLLAYEYMMMYSDELTDSYDTIEEDINSKLRDNDINPEKINNIKRKNINIDAENKEKRINIYIPKSTGIEYIDKDISTILNEAVKNGYKSIWFDRMDRIKGKKAILKYIKTNTIPEHKRAKMVVNDVNSIKTDSLNININIQNEKEFIQQSDEKESWETRYKKLNQLINNSKKPQPSKQYIKYIINEAYNIESEQYINDKIKEFGRKYKPYLKDTYKTHISGDVYQGDIAKLYEEGYSIEQIIYNADEDINLNIYKKITTNAGIFYSEQKAEKYIKNSNVLQIKNGMRDSRAIDIKKEIKKEV